MIELALPEVPGLDRAMAAGPFSYLVAIAAFSCIIYGVVQTIRTRRWLPRLALLAGAAVWPLPDHPLLGPIIVELSYAHGVHAADLLSLCALVAVLPQRKSEQRATYQSQSR